MANSRHIKGLVVIIIIFNLYQEIISFINPSIKVYVLILEKDVLYLLFSHKNF